MKNQKLNLKKLEVKSFMTDMNQTDKAVAKGGGTIKNGGCITVITFGIWTVCCGGDTDFNAC